MRADQEREYVEYVQARVLTLRRTAYRLCGDWHRAEDLVQRTFLRLYRNWRQAAAADMIDAYVRKMLVNVYMDEQRGWWARRVAPVAEPQPDGPPPADAGLAGTDRRLDLMAALAAIAPGQRAVLVLRFWEQLSVAEAAAALGCSEGTVKSQTAHALAALRRRLPDYVREGGEQQ
jgi:RNA polymerase sigma-70 factor (sigma-E family)